jgi:pimeloyl-ACP methyl ester carboxylesterase
VRRLSGYRIYALDLGGHGKSEGRGHQSIGAYASQVIDWLTAMGLHRAVFVGHSMGAAVALHLAIHYSDRVAGVGLIAAGVRLKVKPEIITAAASQTTFRKAADALVRESFGPNAPERLIELVLARILETRSSVVYGDLLACEDFDATEHIASISYPTLVICGSEDRLTPLRYSQFLAGAIPGARLEVIAGAGHMVMLEQPEAVANALINFLPGVPYQPGE